MRVLLPRRPVPAGHARARGYVTVGGAIACDVHGKNHHRDGTFGAHVVSADLVTARRRRRTRSAPTDDAGAVLGDGRRHGPDRGDHVGDAPHASRSRRAGSPSTPNATRPRHADGRDARVGRPLHATRWPGSTPSPAAARSAASVLTRGEHARRDELTGRAARTPYAAAGRPPAARRLPSVPHGLVSARLGPGLQRGVVPQGAATAAGELESIAHVLPPPRRRRRLEPALRPARASSSTSSSCPTTPRRSCATSSTGSRRAATRRSSPCSSGSVPPTRAAVVPDARLDPGPRPPGRPGLGALLDRLDGRSSRPAAGSTWPRTPGCAPTGWRRCTRGSRSARGSATGSTPDVSCTSDLARRLGL